MIRKSLVLLLCLGGLSACERTPQPVAQTPAPLAAPVEAPAAEPAAVAPPPAKAVEAKPVATAAKPQPQPVAKPKPKPAPATASKPAPEPEAKLALDLSVPHELFEQALESETQQELSPLLPPLFGEKPESVSPFQISGRLINNARVDDYWDSIEGAELQFEFKQ